jgi:multidrug efflux pump subunit AcrA (membrane-fusion protein)
MATARLGSITESLALTGRVTAAEEVTVRVRAGDRVNRVKVAVWQAVDAGRLLVELDSKN